MKKRRFFIILFLFIIYIYTFNIYSFTTNSLFIKSKETSNATYSGIKVIPTGKLIGLKLYTNGVLVIGSSQIKSIEGKMEKPFDETDISEGDIITQLDGTEIDSAKTLQNVVDNSEGRNLEIKYFRNETKYSSYIKPIKTENGEYKLGLWVRDSASGVGTMTFYEPKSKSFVALGHGISDNDTGKLLDIKTGEIVETKIVNVNKGKKGFPGEIRGSIANQLSIGTIDKNSNFGVYGTLTNNITIDKYIDGIKIASRDEIRLGDATILANVENDKTEEYKIKITAIDLDNVSNNKSMQIQIIDERLINKTGGIICGMSGCPIIQNDKLIGAVTNVLVSDPEAGFGVFADILIKEMVR